MRSQAAFVIGVLTCCLFGQPAVAGKRVALVIGNSAYQNVAQLPNPIKDAAAFADMFKKAGFDVVESRQNLKNADTRRALNDFFDKVRDADIAVVYYAGHGIEIGGTNYIVPVDASLERDRDAFDEAVSLDRIVQSIEPARQLRLIILDACRDNPFAKNTRRTLATRGVSRGLARVDPDTPNTLVAFAAKAGSTADDGFGEHSPFTTSLLKHLTVPGLDLRRALGRVRDEVMSSTGNRQEPFVYGSLGGEDVSLVPAPSVPVAAAPAAQNSAAEIRADYQLAERIGTKEAWDYFIAAHDGGFYADLAKAQRNKIAAEKAKNSIVAESPANSAQQKQAAVAPVNDQGKLTVASAALPPQSSQSGARVGAIDPDVATTGRKPASKEAPDWDKVKDSSDQSALTGFIKRYPNSPLSIDAQQRLDMLKRAADEREAIAAQARADAALKLAAAEEERAKLAAAERAKLEETQFAEARRREQQRVAEDQRAREEQQRRQVAALAAAPLSTEHDPNAQPPSDQACKEAAAKLAKLRVNPTPEDVVRFEKDLACEQLRPQLVRLRENIPVNILPRPDVAAPIARPEVDEPKKAPPMQQLSIQTPQESPVEKPQVSPSIPQVVTAPPPRPQNKAASPAERRRVTSADCKAINERAQLGDMSDGDRETLKNCRGGMRP